MTAAPADGQRWDLAFPKRPVAALSEDELVLRKKLRLHGQVDVAVAPDRKVARPASDNYADLTTALVRCPDESCVLTITHRASGFALHQAVARPGVHRPDYVIPATLAGVAAAQTACTAILAGVAAPWSEVDPFSHLPPVGDPARAAAGRTLGRQIAAVAFPALEKLLDAQDRKAIADRRRELMAKDRATVQARVDEARAKGGWVDTGTKTGNSRGHAGWVELVIRDEYWWQVGNFWAATTQELAVRDRRFAGG